MATNPLSAGQQIGVSIAGTVGSALGSRNSSSGSSWSRSRTDQSSAMAYNAMMAKQAQDFSRREAQKNRDFQKMMSDTAYQRAVKDMKRAGINPILAAQNGGATAAAGAAGTGYQASIGAEGTSASGSVQEAYGISGLAMAMEDAANAAIGFANSGFGQAAKGLMTQVFSTGKQAFDWFTKPKASYDEKYK